MTTAGGRGGMAKIQAPCSSAPNNDGGEVSGGDRRPWPTTSDVGLGVRLDVSPVELGLGSLDEECWSCRCLGFGARCLEASLGGVLRECGTRMCHRDNSGV